MTKEEELITRWIDGELNPKEKIEFEKLYDARPIFIIPYERRLMLPKIC